MTSSAAAVCFEGLTISGVHLSKNIIGVGAFGSVVESHWHGTPCVTKQLHNVFHHYLPPSELESLVMSFCRECTTWASLRHPHIVQFLGVFFPSDAPHSALPALVLEKMQQSLRHYLEQHDTADFPLLGKVIVLHQVAQALSYLHSKTPALVHHDLSPNNILINEVGFVAKLTDFGMARATCVNRETSVKGTHCFMPPEALQHPPRYDQQLDVFSFGTVIISILTHQWPEPGPPNVYEGDELKAQTEFNRRKQYIQMFSEREQALLLNLVRSCLENRPEARLKSSELVVEVKKIEELLVSESSQRPCHASEMQLVLAAREAELANSRRELTITRDELTSVRHELASVKQELERFQLVHAHAPRGKLKSLDGKSSHGSTFTTSESEPECPPSPPCQAVSECSPSPVQTLKQLLWSPGPRPPMEMEFPIATHVGHFIYVGDRGESRSHIYQLDIAAMTWSQIPMPKGRRRKGYCFASTAGLLHLISGRCKEGGRNVICNEVWTLSSSKDWDVSLPPICSEGNDGMVNAVAVSFDGYIVVAGGEGMGKNFSTVKVVNTRAQSPQWIEVPPLPVGISNAQAVVFNGHVLFGFGVGSTDTLYQASVDELKSLADDPSRHDRPQYGLLWTALPPTPVTRPGVAVVHNCLLSIGGRSSDSRSFVYCYATVNGQWMLTSEARKTRFLLSVVTITRDTRELIFVFGGSTSATPCEFAEIIL